MSEMNTAVLIRTRHQLPDPTELSYIWAETIKQKLETNGWQVIDLAADDAIASQVELALQNVSNEVVIFYGHGFPSCMISQNVEEAIINLNNMTVLKNKKVYVMACWTIQKLGEDAKNIVHCYLGYNKEVKVWFDPLYSNPLGECVNKGILEMLNIPDYTFEQARQQIVAEYNRWIDYFVDKEELNSSRFAAVLRHNRDALRLLGNTECRVGRCAL
jgi:hypothetical protein